MLSQQEGELNVPVIAYLLKKPPCNPNERPPGRGVDPLISRPDAFENSIITEFGPLKSSLPQNDDPVGLFSIILIDGVSSTVIVPVDIAVEHPADGGCV